MTDERRRLFFSFGDIFVYAAILLLIAAFTVYPFFGKQKSGTYFEIVANGKVIYTADLSENASYVFYVEGDKPAVKKGSDVQGLTDYNVIEVKEGAARVILSDCPDHVCYGTGVCLPHGMTLRVHYDEWENDV